MKKLIPILIILTLALSGCGLTEQAKTVNEKYIAPALAEANGESVSGGEFAAGPNVKADWSRRRRWAAGAATSASRSLSPRAATAL